jgi:hypothetical protein
VPESGVVAVAGAGAGAGEGEGLRTEGSSGPDPGPRRRPASSPVEAEVEQTFRRAAPIDICSIIVLIHAATHCRYSR